MNHDQAKRYLRAVWL